MKVELAPSQEAEIDVAVSVVAPRALPNWLIRFDQIVIAILNILMIAEVLFVFGNTMLRTIFRSAILFGFEETSSVFLLIVAFMGGAVAYSRGQFIAITMVVDRMPQRWQEFCAAAVEWIIVAVALIFGVYAVPLYLKNSDETSLMLGISYAWMTFPIALGSALMVIHAGLSALRRPVAVWLPPAVVILAFMVFMALSHEVDWTYTPWLYVLMVTMFVVQLVIGVPIGFILGSVGIAAVYAPASADLIAVVMAAQRGSGGFILLALPFFILAGFITDRADIGSRIVSFLGSLFGHLRGGMMQVMIVGVYISSGISGSKSADMATIGIPMRKKLVEHGYPPHEQGALLAAAAAMGESVPPSIAIIILGSVTSVSTGALFLAGFLPAAVVAACLMLLVYVRAIMSGWHPRPRAPRREVLATGKKAILPLMMPILLMGGIITGIGTPTEVSTFAVLYGLGLGLLYGRLTWQNFWQVLTEASLLIGMIFFTVSAATVFSWALTLEGMPVAIAKAVGSLGSWAFLPAVIIITVLLGALLESFVTIIILAPILLPVALQLHINPLQYGIILVEAFGIGSIFPPIGLALYISCAICGAKVERATPPLIWYLLVMFAGLLLVCTFPWITTVLPTLFNFKT